LQQSQLLCYPYALPPMTALYPSMLSATQSSPDQAAALQSVCTRRALSLMQFVQYLQQINALQNCAAQQQQQPTSPAQYSTAQQSQQPKQSRTAADRVEVRCGPTVACTLLASSTTFPTPTLTLMGLVIGERDVYGGLTACLLFHFLLGVSRVCAWHVSTRRR
jgi:hypothetical protein